MVEQLVQTPAHREVVVTARGRLLRRREDLLRQRAQLLGRLHAMTVSQYDEGVMATHPADAATDLAVAQAAQGDLFRINEELQDIAAALERIEAGTYGVCINCGELVDPARLRAFPTAKRCLRCQREYEYRRGRR